MSKARILESVRRLDVEATTALLERQPALLSVTDRSGRNLLHLACSAPCKDLGVSEAVSARLVSLLLDRGLDVDSSLLTSGYPCNSVWFAVAKGRNATLVELLVQRGARPCGLFAAGWHEDLKLVQLLIDLGAVVDESVDEETRSCIAGRTGACARLACSCTAARTSTLAMPRARRPCTMA